jgi:hypothetical protein
MVGGQGKVDRDMEIGNTDDEQAKICHDKGIGITCRKIGKISMTLR